MTEEGEQSAPPPEPKVSADGKFYFDGERWLPMPSAGGHPAKQPVSAASRSPRRGSCALALLVLGVILIGGIVLLALWRPGAGGLPLSSHSLAGILELHSDSGGILATGPYCEGTRGYDDIKAGTAVTIGDDSGKILATGQLDKGRLNGPAECDFFFKAQVPDASFYQVEVSHRGKVTYSREDLQRNGWQLSMSLGR